METLIERSRKTVDDLIAGRHEPRTYEEKVQHAGCAFRGEDRANPQHCTSRADHNWAVRRGPQGVFSLTPMRHSAKRQETIRTVAAMAVGRRTPPR
jgi:hypothetical protein